MTGCYDYWHLKDKKIHLHCRHCLHPPKIITAYYHEQDGTAQARKRHHSVFRLNFKPLSTLPEDYVIIENQTAFFLDLNRNPVEPYNFFHFTKQIFFPLYWLMKSTGQLRPGANNVVFYPEPYAICDHSKLYYHNIDKFKAFRDVLFIKNKLESSAFTDQPGPNKICYRNAVFSKGLYLDKAAEAVSYFKSKMDVKEDVCQQKSITIINRSNYRRILKTEDLEKVGKELGYITRVVAMEKLTIQEQTQLIHCTSILVGVNGAGMQWTSFMQDHTGVIEIGWPDKDWPFYYSGSGSKFHCFSIH
jgi:adenomatosis polyposis coli protein